MPPAKLLCLTLAAAALGCAPPVETRRRIARDAPILPEPEDDEIPLAVLRPGELVEVLQPQMNLRWKGPIDGKPATRDGQLVHLRATAGDGPSFGFSGDIGEPVEVPSAKWVCERLGAPAECPNRLHRVLLAAGLAAWDACHIGPCRMGVVHGRTVSAITVDGVAEVRPALVEGQEVLIATTRWVRDPNWTGANTIVLRVGATLERVLDIPTQEIDGRTPPSIERMGNLSVDGDGIRFTGTRREVAPSTGAVLRVDPVRELYHVAK